MPGPLEWALFGWIASGGMEVEGVEREMETVHKQ